MKAIDLFAGLGGFSTGAVMAGCEVVWAANHWRPAVYWHGVNHPGTEHACQDLNQANFLEVAGHDILLASPACQGHSPARGKEKPHHDALRATAWAVVTCLEVHKTPVAVIENVKQFMKWVLYPAWTAALQALGYTLSPMILDAADHGVPQHRQRMFLVATRSKAPLVLNLPRRDHVPASRVIQFDDDGWSPVASPKRKPKTLARVANGRARFGERFLMPYYGSGSGLTGRDLARPIGTLTTRARWAVVDGDRMRMVRAANEGRALMGFPPDTALPDIEKTAWTLLGNAVCPQVACDVLNEIKRAA